MTKKNALAQWFFRLYVGRRVRRTFGKVSVSGLAALKTGLEAGPVVVVLNHVAFWDVFVLLLIEQALDADAYALMDQQNYEKLSFFRWLGALPLRRESPRAAYRDVLAAAELLDRPGRLLFIFPQGRQQPAHLPLQFHSGFALAARHKGIPVVPVALRYDFGEDPKPRLLISIGRALAPMKSDRQMCAALEGAVAAELRHIDSELLGTPENFVPLLASAEVGLPLGSQLLAWLAGMRRA